MIIFNLALCIDTEFMHTVNCENGEQQSGILQVITVLAILFLFGLGTWLGFGIIG